MAVVFGVMVAYIYSLYAFYYISETMFNLDTGTDGGENYCISVWLCFLNVITLVSKECTKN